MTGLSALGMVNAMGEDLDRMVRILRNGGRDHLDDYASNTMEARIPVGRFRGELPSLAGKLRRYDCRNHRLAHRAYLQIADAVERARAKFGAGRIGVVLGSSTAGLDATERAYAEWRAGGVLPSGYDYKKQHAMGSVAAVIAEAGGLGGPCYTLSTACTSSAKAMISARELIGAGICDAVVTGGVDTLCDMTLEGFAALGALSPGFSNPMSVDRDGLNIGEGAALFLMTRGPAPIELIGSGESCDAYHMSAPQPEGLGAEAAMRAALEDAGLGPERIAYLNLHGTGTPLNDAMESLAVDRVLGSAACSSTKPFVGHCLGAAGAIEAGFCWLALRHRRNGFFPPIHQWDGRRDPALPELNLVEAGDSVAEQNGEPIYVMSNSFAFGGNNCSVILAGRKDAQ